MGSSETHWARELKQREADENFGSLTYSRIYVAIVALCRRKRSKQQVFDNLANTDKLSQRLASFIKNATPKVYWFDSDVLPKVYKLVELLEGMGRRSNEKFRIDLQSISGGPHALVEWEDGQLKLMYVIGPRYSERRIANLMTLQQLYARDVYGMDPTQVVIVDLARKKIWENMLIDPDGERLALETVRKLKIWPNRSAS